MLIQVQFNDGGRHYTYHCSDDTDVRVGDKVEVPTTYASRHATVTGIGSDYVKDVIEVLPRKRFHTRVQAHRHSTLWEDDWLTFEDARTYLIQWLKVSSSFEVFELRCDE